MKQALVTGAAGFVGRHMVAALKDRGYHVVRWDILEGNNALDLFRRPTFPFDLVVHAAAAEPHRAAIDNSPMNMAKNLELDAAMFGWAARTGQKRVLYLSSCAVLDGPDDYGWTKLTGERMVTAARRAGIPVTVVRPYSGYGEDQSEDWPFGAFVARARRRDNPFVIWGDGTQVRDWIHIDDIVAAALALVDNDVDGPVSLCTGRGTSMAELVGLVCAEASYRPDIELRTDMPAGAASRIGDPTLLRRWYVPQVSLEEGVKRAMSR